MHFTSTFSWPRALPSRSIILLLPLLTLPTLTRAFVITGYTPVTHNRFSSGFGSDPQTNTSELYIGNTYDLSGVGWLEGSGMIGGERMRNATLLTPLHIIQATHNRLSSGSPLQFMNSLGDVLTVQIQTPVSAVTTTANDISVSTLTNTFEAAQQVTPYRVLDVRTNTLTNRSLLIYGSNADSQGARIGFGVGYGDQTNAAQQWVSDNSALYWESGDSGSPAFVRYTAPDGTTTLTYAGAAWGANAFSTLLPSGTNYNPAASVNNITKLDGYAIKWTIYDNPVDTQNTAQRWSNASGTGVLSSSANWTGGASPAGQPVLFDSSVSGGSLALTLDAELAIRGALFKASANGGFTFSGSGALAIGATGLRNESIATQVFNVGIRLTDSQNWEAASGAFIFNGSIDTGTGAHLVAIGGTQSTTFNNVVSGTGGLAKDDMGVLTLNAANTYTGKTWIHGGTLLVGNGSLPATTEVIFDTTQTAVLDLAGHNQTVAGLRSAYGGTGTIALGSGTLTVGLTSSNTFAGSINGSGGLTTTGTQLLNLTGTNSYTGATTLSGGTVRIGSAGALSTGSNIVIAGGSLELGTSDFTAALGTGAGQIRFTGSGGFSAFGADRIVNLGGATTPLTLSWGAANFVPAGSFLLFSSSFADATVDFRNSIILGSSGTGQRNILATNGSAAVDARLSGNISDAGGAYGINKYNSGTLELTGVNTYAGATAIYGGTLRISSSTALSSASNVTLAGGVLELAYADYNATLGTGAGQVRFTGSGGFSAAGANRSVNLGGLSTPLTLAWGGANFLSEGQALILSSIGADALVDFRNSVVLVNGSMASRTIQVDNGRAAVDARLSGNLSDFGGVASLIKTGAGTLELTGNNSYQGTTTINGGALRTSSANSLPIGNLVLSGGVLELGYGNFSSSLGTGAGQVRITGNAGFSASGANRIVNLGGASATLAWDSANFVSSGNSLVLSNDSSDATLIFQNSINLGSSGSLRRTFQVNNGSAAVDARLSGNLSQSGGTFGITKAGAGTLEMTGTNTYAGATAIIGGALRISSPQALPSSSNVILAGGVLELNSGNYAATIGTGAGQIQFAGSGGFSAAGADRTVTLTNSTGGNVIDWGDLSSIARDYALILSSEGADATIDFKNPLRLNGTGPAIRIVQVNNGTAAVDARLSGAITQRDGVYGITKTGTGTLELTAANGYQGATFVNEGTLYINGNQGTANGAVVVAAGATLGGNGRIGGSTTIKSGGTLALGTQPRTLTFNQTLNFETGATLRVLLDNGSASSVAGTGYDRFNVTGSTALNGTTLDLDLSNGFAASAQTGVVFTILSTSALSGSFSTANSVTTILDGKTYTFFIDYGPTDLKLTLTNITAIPEPATCAIVFGFLTLTITVRRRRR